MPDRWTHLATLAQSQMSRIDRATATAFIRSLHLSLHYFDSVHVLVEVKRHFLPTAKFYFTRTSVLVRPEIVPSCTIQNMIRAPERIILGTRAYYTSSFNIYVLLKTALALERQREGETEPLA